jgi:hypothetical protein
METDPTPQCARAYKYFNRSFKVEVAFFMLLAPVLVTLWLFAAYYFYYSGRVSLSITRVAVYFTITSIFLQIFYGNFRMISRSKSVVVEKDRIIKKNIGMTYTLLYSGITNIRRPKFLFFKRWMILETPQNSLSIPLYMCNGYEMVERIFGNLEKEGIFFEGLANLKQQFYNASKRFQILQELRARRLTNVLHIAAGVAAMNTVIAMLFWERGLVVALVWGYFNLCCQVGAYFFAEDFHVRKIFKTGADGSFSSYYLMAGLIALLLAMALGITATESVL